MITIESNLLIAIAAIITAVVGIFVYFTNRRASANKNKIDGANTAITGLDLLAKQHGVELKRISDVHQNYYVQCELDKKNFAEVIAKHEGQIDVLKSIPLVNIDATFQKIGEFNQQVASSIDSLNKNSVKILESLQQSSDTLKEDTKKAAEKVADVKTDLQQDDKEMVRKVSDEGGGE